jgi:hydroxymethylpyrimidine/phosphomethylpyrimidine kinase
MASPAQFTTPPVALSIAGSDSSAGAGLQADLKTFSAQQTYGLTAATCIVSELPGKVSRIMPCPAELVQDQVALLLAGFPIAGVKTGMLYNTDIISAVADIFRALPEAARPPLIVDPVMIATSGDALLRADGVRAYEEMLFPLATVITPNLDEASALLGKKIFQREQLHAAACELSQRYGCAVLLKGGHLPGTEALDVLVTASEAYEFTAPFVPHVSTHGTGCTYSAAITAGMARGLPLAAAVAAGKKYITAAIGQSYIWGGVQALNHFPTL